MQTFLSIKSNFIDVTETESTWNKYLHVPGFIVNDSSVFHSNVKTFDSRIDQLHILFHSEMSYCRIMARFMLTISKTNRNTNDMHIKLMRKELIPPVMSNIWTVWWTAFGQTVFAQERSHICVFETLCVVVHSFDVMLSDGWCVEQIYSDVQTSFCWTHSLSSSNKAKESFLITVIIIIMLRMKRTGSVTNTSVLST